MQRVLKKTQGVCLSTFLDRQKRGWGNYLHFFQKADFTNSKETQKRHLLFAVVGLMLTGLMTTIADYYEAFSLVGYFSKPQE